MWITDHYRYKRNRISAATAVVMPGGISAPAPECRPGGFIPRAPNDDPVMINQSRLCAIDMWWLNSYPQD